ncbi:cytokine-inducible SH2-containing protein-like [Astyanax mexicanus]|uniref:Cytokine-inducible SH2-containing protein n=1 Tax=Astyanax mexicanus TaxID=7994 RepID=A0A8B9RJP5_ASTMX|nr:cytokine-inducible SH2-containing protein-like [Astyanax mexicanus]
MLLCLPRPPLPGPSSVMVSGRMRVPNDGAESDDRCNQLIPVQPITPQSWDPTEDLRCITTAFQHLHASGWYWGSISASEARDALSNMVEGTFLVRDSSHPHYMLTLSVKTARGPTNVRIEYSGGHFRLDSTSPARPRLLSFPTVPGLVQHYLGTGGKEERGNKGEEVPVALKDSAIVMKLRQPLHSPKNFPSLQHLTRLAINRHTDRPAQLPLPRLLLLYLQDYPFQV